MYVNDKCCRVSAWDLTECIEPCHIDGVYIDLHQGFLPKYDNREEIKNYIEERVELVFGDKLSPLEKKVDNKIIYEEWK